METSCLEKHYLIFRLAYTQQLFRKVSAISYLSQALTCIPPFTGSLGEPALMAIALAVHLLPNPAVILHSKFLCCSHQLFKMSRTF